MTAARALGFHRTGETVRYALVERGAGRPPEVLAAGTCPVAAVAGLHLRLAGERPLPWALAEDRGGGPPAAPGGDWPLRRPEARGLLHPAVAAAWWEWELGRIAPGDLFLWLRADRLLWVAGEPGRSGHGQQARKGPLRDLVATVLREAGPEPAPVAVVVDGDAPGGEILREALAAAGRTIRPVRALPEERGADLAAAGAALAALDPHRPGVRPPRRGRSLDPWVVLPSLLAAAGLGGALALERLDRPAAPTAQAGQPAEPGELGRILARRRAMARALEAILAAAPAGSIEELELLSTPGETGTEVRLRLLPGGDPAWATRLPGGHALEVRRLADGSVLLRGPWASDGKEEG